MENLVRVLTDSTAPAYIIAEIGQAHDGSLGAAHAYIDAVAATGVNAIKFQTHIAKAESTRHEQFRVSVFPQDATRYDYWKRMEFTAEQWKALAAHAKDVGLDFLSTPFSVEAVQLLDELGVPAWKIGSGDTSNTELLNAVLKTKKPVLLSSGMSSYAEIENVISMIKENGSTLALFQCTTSYPCNPEDVGYNIIEEMITRFNCPVGLSDHSGTPFPSLAAVAFGAKILEVHAVFSKQSFGPDTSSSLTIEELRYMVEGVRFIEKGIENPIDKDLAAKKRADTKNLFSRSAFYTKGLIKGEVLTENSFAMKKPAGGLSYGCVQKLIGKEILIDRVRDDFIKAEDFK